jgi:hypothetical protein
MITFNAFSDWLAAADGGSFVYHTGHLARDCQTAVRAGDAELPFLASKIFEAAVAGRVYLLQRRVALESWEHLAIAPRKGWHVPDALRPLPMREYERAVTPHTLRPHRERRRIKDASAA